MSQPVTEYSEKYIARWKTIGSYCAVVAFAIGTSALVGWTFNNDFLKRIHPSLVTMKVNTAICLMLASLSLILLRDGSSTRVRKLLGQLFAVIVVIIGLLSLSEHVFGWNLGIDQLISNESVADAGQSLPGRMGIAASLDFFFLGIALLFLDVKLRGRFWIADFFVFSSVLITLLVFLYYFYGIEKFEPIAPYLTIAVHTVIAFFSLCAAILLIRPNRGVIAAFLGNSAGSIVARRMWPAMLAIVFLGWLRSVGQKVGFFGPGFATAAFVLMMLFIFTGLIWWIAVSLNRADRKRDLAELALRRSETRLAAVLEQLPAGVGLLDTSGRWLVANTQLSRFVGEVIPSFDPIFRDRWKAWDSEGQLLDPSEWPSARALRGEMVNPGLEMLYTTEQGEQIWTRVGSVPFKDQTGEIAGAIAVIQEISEQKRAAEATGRLAAIIESSEDAIISKDLEGIITSWNSGAQRLFGYSADEVVGKSITILIPHERLHEEPEILRRIRRGERIEHYETVRQTKNGTLLDISLTVSPIRDAQNKIIGVSKIARDITGRKRAEARLDLLVRVSDLIQTLHGSTELSYEVAKVVGTHLDARRCLFNETNVLLDLEIVQRDYSDGVESVAGVHRISDYSSVTSAEMQAGKTVVNCDSKTDPRTTAEYDRIYGPSGERAYVAVPLMRDDVWVASLWVSDNKPRQWSKEDISLLQTVGERTWTAIEKLRIDTALRESEERLRLATDASEMYAWEFDLKTGINRRSGNAEKVVGFSLPDNLTDAAILIHPDDRDHALGVFNDALEKKGEFEMEYRLVNPVTNDEVWVSTTGKIIVGADQEPSRVVGVTQNVTKRKLAESDLEQLLQREQEARDAAEKANRLKDEFLATLSHELRNPLNVILGYSEILLRMPEIEQSSSLRHMSEALRRNAKSQSQLINDLLDLSRLQTGKISLNQEKISVATIVDNAVETVRSEASAKGIEITVNKTNQLILVDGDQLRLQQVAWNLLNNAVKFTSTGGTVAIDVSNENGNAILSVCDTGQGIEPEFLPHVFEMFRQGDSSNNRKHGGMGIGLALVQKLVQLHGGTVSADSEGSGKGSRFTVELPLTAEAESAKPPPSDVHFSELAQTDFLVVDDSEDTVAMLEHLLKIQGANVTTATNGFEALSIASERKFDVILSDISMPEMDGFEFLRRLRLIPGRKDIPVVAITGFGRIEDIERARTFGFFSHLTKPLDLESLAAVLNELGDERRKKR